MLGKLFKALMPGARTAPAAPTPEQVLEDALADVEGLFGTAAIARLEGMLRDGSGGAAHAYALGTLHLGAQDWARAREAFHAARGEKESSPYLQQCLLGEAIAGARIARDAGRRPPLRALDDAARRTPVSVVICSNRPERYAKASAHYARLLEGVPHDLVHVDDARSLCEGYARGLARAKGELVVFSHDDIEIVSPDFAAKLHAHLCEVEVVGVAGTTRLVAPRWWAAGWPEIHGQVAQPGPKGRWNVTVFGVHAPLATGAQALDGLVFAARREVAEAVGFDAETFDGWHFYDLDFTFSAATRGHRLGVACDVLVHHESTGRFDEDWKRYAARFTEKHGPRMAQPRDERPRVAFGSALHAFGSAQDWIEANAQLLEIAAERRAAA